MSMCIAVIEPEDADWEYDAYDRQEDEALERLRDYYYATDDDETRVSQCI